MKKKITYLVLSIGILLLVGGCSSKDKDKDTDATPTPAMSTGDGTGTDEGTEAEYAVNDLVKEEYNVDDYITLGKYKGIEVTADSVEVTPDDITVAIQSDLESFGAALKEVSGRAVKIGDTVNIDYEGLKDGVAFEGGTDTGYNLMIGSNSFIPGFEDQLIGTKTGDKVELDVTFPEDYSEDLAGQPVIFKVTVNKIQEYEVTDEVISANTDHETVDAYKAALGETLKTEKEANRQTVIENSVYDAVLKGSTISSLPQTLIDYYKNDIKIYYTNFASAYGMDFAGFLSASGVTEAQFDEDAMAYAESMSERDLVLNAVMKAEGIELSEDEFNKQVAAYAEEYQYESAEALLAEADPVLLREDILFKKVRDFLVTEAIVK